MATSHKASNAVEHFFQTMGRFELLSEEEVIELSRKVQAWQQNQAGPDHCSPIIKRIGMASRDKLVRHNLRLVIKIWRDKYSSRVTPADTGLADLLQHGAQCLIRAAELYDASKGHKFSTYAAPWIHKGFKSYLGNEERTVRMPSNNYFLTRAALSIQTNRTAAGLAELTMEELAEELSKTRRKVPSPSTLGNWLRSYMLTTPRSFTERVGDNCTELGDLLADSKVDDKAADTTYERTMEAMRYLTEFERDVIERRHIRNRGPVGYKSVARILKKTEVEVIEAEARAFKRIRLMVTVD